MADESNTSPEALARRIDWLLHHKNAIEAVQLVEVALARDPANPATHRQLGQALKVLGKMEAAIEAFETACFFSDNPWESLCDIGDLQLELRNFDEAIQAFRLALNSNRSNGIIHASIAFALCEQGNLKEARQEAEQGAELSPHEPYPYFVLGAISNYEGHLAESGSCFEKALQIDSEYANAHTALGITRLMLGHLDYISWQHYAWRFKRSPFQAPPPHFQQVPQWDGEGEGAKVLIWGEQGIGDMIFSLGFVNQLGLKPEQMFLCMEERLLPLCKRSFPGTEASHQWPNDPADAGITHTLPCCSMAGQVLPSCSSWEGRPFLRADPQRVQSFTEEMGKQKNDILIGVSWKSLQVKYGTNKSISLLHFSALAAIPEVRLVDLQYGETEEERADFLNSCGYSLLRPELDRTNDLDSLAALIMACDFVVSISNVTAHLTGALGKEGWILAPSAHGLLWYWKQHGPFRWYPSLHLLPQREICSWDQELQTLRMDVEQRMSMQE